MVMDHIDGRAIQFWEQAERIQIFIKASDWSDRDTVREGVFAGAGVHVEQ